MNLHEDLELGINSAWQQYALAFQSNAPVKDGGGTYVILNASDSLNPVIRLGERSRYLRQYFRYVRRGAVRFSASSNTRRFSPLAFVNTDGRYVLVVKADRAGTFTAKDLPPGTYGVSYTTAEGTGVTEREVARAATFSASIPAAGVITVFAQPVRGPGSGAQR